jgi:hypothetical protein
MDCLGPRKEESVFGERDRIGAVVAEPLSDKNPLATEISAPATLVLVIVIAIPVPQPSDLPKLPPPNGS